MRVKVYGEGPRTAVALHGWGGDHREFAAVAARRPDSWRMISPDLPGYGGSPPPAAWTWEAVLTPLEAALDEHAPGGADTMAGFCSGAIVALWLALRRPDCCRRLVLIDPFAYLPWYFRIFTLGEFGRRAYLSTFAGRRGPAAVNAVLRKRQASEADFTAAFRGLDPDVVLNWLKLLAATGDHRRFAGVRTPVVLVHGDRTFRAVREAVRRFAAQWPGTPIRILENAGHLPLVRRADTLAELVFGEAGGR